MSPLELIMWGRVRVSTADGVREGIVTATGDPGICVDLGDGAGPTWYPVDQVEPTGTPRAAWRGDAA